MSLISGCCRCESVNEIEKCYIFCPSCNDELFKALEENIKLKKQIKNLNKKIIKLENQIKDYERE
jgi:hypothetical protein